MKTIHKFNLKIQYTQEIEMSTGAILLRVQKQVTTGLFALWALVDTDRPKEMRTVCIAGTGHQLPENWGVYLDTVQDGAFVWHFFIPTQQL